jgi:hypothetical protein
LETWLLGTHRLDLSDPLDAIAASGVQHLPPPGDPGIGVEIGFSIERDVARYTGRVDLVFHDGARPVVVDHKTTAGLGWAKTEEELRSDPQVVLYARAAFEQWPDAAEVETRWVYYQTKAPHRSKRVSLTVLREKNENDMTAIDSVARELNALHDAAPAEDRYAYVRTLEPNVHHCDAFGGCAFREICNLTIEQRLRGIMAQQETLAEKIKRQRAEREGTETATVTDIRTAKTEPTAPEPEPAADAPGALALDVGTVMLFSRVYLAGAVLPALAAARAPDDAAEAAVAYADAVIARLNA